MYYRQPVYDQSSDQSPALIDRILSNQIGAPASRRLIEELDSNESQHSGFRNGEDNLDKDADAIFAESRESEPNDIDDPNLLPRSIQPTNALQCRAASDLLDEIVHNELPIRLIYTRHGSEKLVERDDVAESIRHVLMPEVTDDPWDQQVIRVRAFIRDKASYAILSHRWLAKGEVILQDWFGKPRPGIPWPTPEDHRRRPNIEAGRTKLLSFCTKAASYACLWAWADTCCIDKKSSAELDESIRSMYRWYRNARICIVHLNQTETVDDLDGDEWFRRGWTLQELLAPTRLKFFNARWEPLRKSPCDVSRVPDVETGFPKIDPSPSAIVNNESFLTMLSDAAAIPVQHLLFSTPGMTMIRDKMIWASKRKTTRIEDRAYSLAGIFDINMTISYGEGDAAFFRLQKAILEQRTHEGLFVWHGAASSENSMFAKSPDSFAPVSNNCHFARVLSFLYRNFSNYSESLCISVASSMIPRGGTTFALTNAGLRISLILYDAIDIEIIGTKWRLRVKGLKQVETDEVRPIGMFTEETLAREEYGREEMDVIRSEDAVEGSPIAGGGDGESDPGMKDAGEERVNIFKFESRSQQLLDEIWADDDLELHRSVRIGVLDYERDDANNNPYRFKEELYNSWNKYTSHLPKNQKKLTKDILTARRERWYTAILLYRSIPGPDRSFERIVTENIIQVWRPSAGWKAPQEVYIR